MILFTGIGKYINKNVNENKRYQFKFVNTYKVINTFSTAIPFL